MADDHPHTVIGCPVFDVPGTCPGLPRGKVLHLVGPPASGKTTLALMAAAKVCQGGGVVGYIDTMLGFTPDGAEHLGVPYADQDRFLLFHPDTQEEGIQIAARLLHRRVDLVVFDALGIPVMDVSTLQETREMWANHLPMLEVLADRQRGTLLGLDYPLAGLAKHVGGQPWNFGAHRRVHLTPLEGQAVGFDVTKDVVGGATGTLGTFDLPWPPVEVTHV